MMSERPGDEAMTETAALRARLACPKCRESLRQSLVQDKQTPERADSATALSHAAYCDGCAALALAPLGACPEAVGTVKAAAVCSRCRAIFGAQPLPGHQKIPPVFLKAICWAYLCEECAEIVVRAVRAHQLIEGGMRCVE